MILEIAWDYPLGFIVGWGKEIFGPLSSAFDNEWLYVGLVYGPIVFLGLLCIAVLFLIQASRRMIFGQGPLRGFETALFLIVPSGLLFAWPGAFFTQISIACLISILVSCHHWERRSLRLQE
jgi:hypothetical protein